MKKLWEGSKKKHENIPTKQRKAGDKKQSWENSIKIREGLSKEQTMYSYS